MKKKLLEFWYDDVRRTRVLRIVGLVVRILLVIAVVVMLWSWLNIPGETEHQLYLSGGLAVLAVGLFFVNYLWYKG